VTHAVCIAVPPAPVQVTEYGEVAAGETDTLPDVAPPVVKSLLAQEVAFVELQVRVDDWPRLIVLGFGTSVTAGAGVVGAAVTPTTASLLAEPPVLVVVPGVVVCVNVHAS